MPISQVYSKLYSIAEKKLLFGRQFFVTNFNNYDGNLTLNYFLKVLKINSDKF